VLVFIAKRLAGAAFLLLVVSFLVFSLFALTPGSVLATLLGGRASTPELVSSLTKQYHLNDSFVSQYWHWLGSALHFDFGRSTQSGEAVTTIVGRYVPVTGELAVYALVLVILFGVPAGMLGGIIGGRVDRGISLFTIVGLSAPPFAAGILLIYFLGVGVQAFPVYGIGTGAVDRIYHLTLPALALAVSLIALVARQTRAASLQVMHQDYVTFARARGLKPSIVLGRYALRNISLPIVTSAGLVLVFALSGTVLVENVFSLPGAGTLMVKSVNARDLPVVQALAMMSALFVVVINIVVDVIAAMVDPRIRYAIRA